MSKPYGQKENTPYPTSTINQVANRQAL